MMTKILFKIKLQQILHMHNILKMINTYFADKIEIYESQMNKFLTGVGIFDVG